MNTNSGSCLCKSVTVLYIYQTIGEEKHTFIELKRPDMKGQPDISQYVSWFWIDHSLSELSKPIQLLFLSWEGKVRTFEQGILTMTAEDNMTASFQIASSSQNLLLRKVEMRTEDSLDMVEACDSVWCIR